MLRDIERVQHEGSCIRFVIGEYGSGKTFFLNLVRLIALEKGLVAMSADLTPERRLYSTAGQARSLFAEMARNLSTRTKPGGGALRSVVERFVSTAVREAGPGGSVDAVIRSRLARFEDLVGGYDFATVVGRYWEGHEEGDEQLKSDALRWLRAEFSTRLDSRRALGVRTIVTDASVYDHLKLMSVFVREAGYKGLLLVLDEMVNLFKLANSRSRNGNYEQILRILNDVLQGSASSIGFVMGGTPEFLMDTRRGLYSYPALQSRLAENAFARNGLVDLSGPVIALQNLSAEDLYVLLANIRAVFSSADGDGRLLVPDECLKAFMSYCSARIGDAYFRTPRNTVKAFVNMLSVIEQNPGVEWRSLVGEVEVARDDGTGADIDDSDSDGEDELATFRL